MVVQHNLKAMNSNRMLGITQSTQAKSTEKLSSGYKINRAADDAAGLSISEKMRKQIRGLTQASTNAQDGISAVQTAEGALNEVQDMLQRMNELAVKAANGTNSVDDRSYIQDEIDQLVDEIDRVAETTKFNETYLLKGTEDDSTKKVNFQYKSASLIKMDVYYMDSNNAVKSLSAGDYAAGLDSDTQYFSAGDITKVGVGSAEVFSTYANSMTNLYSKAADAESYTLLNPGDALVSDTIYYSGTYDSSAVVQNLGSIAGSDAGEAHYYNACVAYDSAGNSYAASKLDIGTDSEAASGVYSAIGSAQLMKNPVDFSDITEGTGKVQFVDADNNEVAENGLYRYINEDGTRKEGTDLRVKATGAQVDETIIKNYVDLTDKYSRGTLDLKLHVGADATDNNQISVKIDAMNAEQLGVKEIKVDGKDDTNARNAIETIKEALQKVSTQRSALGAAQNRLEHTIANLDNVVENTTSAESGIRDTDMATEMVKYSNNNILAQAGQAMLAQANQSNQGVLSLLG